MWGVGSWGTMLWGVEALTVPLASPLGWMVLGSLLTIVGWVVLRRSGTRAASTLAALVVLVPLTAWAGSVGPLQGFVNGTIADAIHVNENFAAVAAAVDDNDARLDQLDARFGQNTSFANAGTGGECTLAQVWLTAGAVANGVPAEGQILAIAPNPALFSLLGTIYGGDGETTFALPDLRDAAPSGLTYVICVNGLYPSLL